MVNKDFTHLHVHTEYSLLDGSGKIEQMILKAKELGMDSIAITDHGTMYGCVDFYKAAKNAGIKPIIGCEIYVAEKSMYIKENNPQNKTHHLVLLVKNEIGYKNLMKIVSKASIDGFYYKPRVDHEYLKQHSEGIIALSGCLAGEVQSYLLQSEIEKAKQIALFYKEIFKDGFYFELQYHGIDDQLKINQELIKLSRELSIPLVATNDVHYINKKDFKAHDILLCIQTGKKVYEDDRMKYPSGQFYLKSPEEMYNQFSYVPEAIENTIKIARECNFDYEFHKSKLPNFPLDEGIDHYDYMRKLCYKGLEERYEEVDSNITDRLEYELNVIKEMGYVDYFLIVWDFIRFAKEKDIMTGPGRGSAAGSIVAYTLGITKIDPIKYNLIFERFLNPERVSMPDIDSDLCYERRQEVIDYVVEKYGSENVSQIVTFGTMAPRACIRDVGRAMDYSYSEVDKIAKMIPNMIGITIDKALEINSELKSIYDDDERIRELIDIARALEGIPRHTSTHAAGVVIASNPLVDFVPLQQNEGVIVTQFTMGTLEELGLLKMDFLGLRTLTVMRDTILMVKDNKNIDIDLDAISFDDKEVYKMIGEGETTGIFQLESSGMTNFMKDLKPDNLEDIIAGISLYRPGPMSEIPRYIKNKNSPDEIIYDTPELEHILEVTHGCIVYQEQVMQIVRDLAGYSMGRSDIVRRAMSKKEHKVMEEERHNFIHGIIDDNENMEVPGCLQNGISETIANEIFDSMMDFASYAFNKSHAAAYAVVAYETAYLIRYYPVEYIAAMLNSVMGDNDKVAYYVRFARESNIDVLPPDINESYTMFTVKGNTIRFGLAAVKNVGTSVIDGIVKCRNEKGKFKDFMDFSTKVDMSLINKRAVESLIKAGAFDNFNIYRSKLLAVYEKIFDGVSSRRKNNIDGQISLFSDFKDNGISNIEFEYPDIDEFSKRDILAMEKEMTGLYLSGHPLDEYKHILDKKTSIKISEIHGFKTLEQNDIVNDFQIKDKDKVVIGGIISSISKKVTRNNEMMAFLHLEDLYGSIEVIVFPNVFRKYISILKEDQIVTIKGKVSIREDELPKVLCENIDLLIRDDDKKVYIRVKDEESIRKEMYYLKPIIMKFKGDTPVYFWADKERKKFKLNEELWISMDKEILSFLEKRFGEENIKIL